MCHVCLSVANMFENTDKTDKTHQVFYSQTPALLSQRQITGPNSQYEITTRASTQALANIKLPTTALQVYEGMRAARFGYELTR